MCTSVKYDTLSSVQLKPILATLHADVKFVLWLSFKITGKLVRGTLQLFQSLA